MPRSSWDNEDRRLILEGLAERAGRLIAEQHIADGGDGNLLELSCDAFARLVRDHAVTAFNNGVGAV
jgi:hypothetical protein